MLIFAPIAPPPPAVYAPPAAEHVVPDGPSSQIGDWRITTWTPTALNCNGAPIKSIRLEQPRPTPGERMTDVRKSVTFTFKIDNTGRPYSIAPAKIVGENRTEKELNFGYSLAWQNSDFEPSLASSQFVAHAAADRCSVTYVAQVAPVREAPIGQIVELSMSDDGMQLANALSGFLRRPNSTCDDNPIPRVLYFPPLDTLPSPVGHISKLLLQFNVDASGGTTGIETIYNSGGPEMEASAIQALTQSRFAPAAKMGCLIPYWQPSNSPLKAPPSPKTTDFIISKSSCPNPGSQILHVGQVPFPEEFRRRNIQGWAFVRFDVAPWGEVGNVSVLAAEPASGFGEQAVTVVQAANADKSPAGYSGCVARIVFKLDDTSPPGVYGGKP